MTTTVRNQMGSSSEHSIALKLGTQLANKVLDQAMFTGSSMNAGLAWGAGRLPTDDCKGFEQRYLRTVRKADE